MKKLNATHADSPLRQMAIIEAALACFNEKGFTDASIADICRKAKASTGSVYHHFRSKSGVAAAVYMSGIRDYQAGMIEVLKPKLSARDGIFALIACHLNWVADHPHWARFLFQHRHAEFMGGRETEEALHQLNAGFAGGMAAWFRKHIEAGSLKALPRDIFISLLLGPCQEFARQYLAGYGLTDVRQAAIEIAKGAWAALASDS